VKCPKCGAENTSLYGYFDEPETMRCNACLDRRERWVRLAMLVGLVTAFVILIVMLRGLLQ